MKIGKLDCYIGSEPIWKYERKNGLYLVRERGKLPNDTNCYVIKSPSEKLYSFYGYSGSIDDAINDIIERKAEDESFFCYWDSIYDEI